MGHQQHRCPLQKLKIVHRDIHSSLSDAKRRFAGKSSWKVYSAAMHKLQTAIEQHYASGSLTGEALVQAKAVFQELREALTRGEVRSAEKINGHWQANAWVKQG